MGLCAMKTSYGDQVQRTRNGGPSFAELFKVRSFDAHACYESSVKWYLCRIHDLSPQMAPDSRYERSFLHFGGVVGPVYFEISVKRQTIWRSAGPARHCQDVGSVSARVPMNMIDFFAERPLQKLNCGG